MGNLCNVDLIISLSGQFDLTDEKKRQNANELLFKSRDERYLKLDELDNSTVVYFNPCFSKQDAHHHCLARGNNNITIIEIKSSFHGVPFYPFALKKILDLNKNEFRKLSRVRHNMLLFSFRFCNWLDFYNWVLFQLRKLPIRFNNRINRFIK